MDLCQRNTSRQYDRARDRIRSPSSQFLVRDTVVELLRPKRVLNYHVVVCSDNPGQKWTAVLLQEFLRPFNSWKVESSVFVDHQRVPTPLLCMKFLPDEWLGESSYYIPLNQRTHALIGVKRVSYELLSESIRMQ